MGLGALAVRGIRRGDVFVVDLESARGSEIRKARPRLVVSADELATVHRVLAVLQEMFAP